LGLGLVSCVVVTWLSQDFLFYDRSKGLRARMHEVSGFFMLYTMAYLGGNLGKYSCVQVGNDQQGICGDGPSSGYH
jgi:hypothetical protein